MPTEVQPPELAELLDYAERSRVGDWSLRSALTRYAQPQPQRVADLLELVRRIDSALAADRKEIDAQGPVLWKAVQSDPKRSNESQLVGLVRVMVPLDELGDVLATWAADPSGERPDGAVDAAITDVTARLDRMDVPREERRRPPGRRRG